MFTNFKAQLSEMTNWHNWQGELRAAFAAVLKRPVAEVPGFALGGPNIDNFQRCRYPPVN